MGVNMMFGLMENIKNISQGTLKLMKCLRMLLLEKSRKEADL